MLLNGLPYLKCSRNLKALSMIILTLIILALIRLLLRVIDIKNARHAKKGLSRNYSMLPIEIVGLLYARGRNVLEQYRKKYYQMEKNKTALQIKID